MNDDSIFIVYLLIAFAVVIIGTILMNKRYNRLIEEKMQSIGADNYSATRKFGFFKVGPFKWVNRYQSVYCIDYVIDGESKECWAKFSAWGEPDWRI